MNIQPWYARQGSSLQIRDRYIKWHFYTSVSECHSVMLGNINNKLLISIVMFICQMPIICFINSFYLVNYFVFLSGYFPHQFVTAMSRIEFGKDEKILCGRGWYQICTDWLTDWLFIVNLQLEVTHTDWQRRIFSGETTGGKPREGNRPDPAEPRTTEGWEDVQRRVRMSGLQLRGLLHIQPCGAQYHV